MREIKFRGRYVGDYVMDEYIAEGTMLYGGYVEIEGKPYIIPKDDTATQVTPESVVQLVGIDADGKEIYEGDYVEIVHDGKQYVYQAHLEGFATGNDGIYLTSKQLSTARRI